MSSDASVIRERLVEVISNNGQRRDVERSQDHAEGRNNRFAADRVLQEENGFELWLGSLEDALCLEGLKDRGIDAVVNCAIEECERECAVYRTHRLGRRRTHARGPSATEGVRQRATDDEEPMGVSETIRNMDREQVYSVVLFDGEWYSSVLERDVAYHGMAADDAPDYDMRPHLSDSTAFIAQCRKEGRKVLIHCIMGINRSSTTLVAFMCEGLGMTLDKAVGLASESRGYILSNASFLDQLIGCYGPDAIDASEDTKSFESGSSTIAPSTDAPGFGASDSTEDVVAGIAAKLAADSEPTLESEVAPAAADRKVFFCL